MTVHSGEARLCVTVDTLVLAVEIYSNPFTPLMTVLLARMTRARAALEKTK